MKVVRNSILPLKGFKALTLWPFIFVRKGARMDAATLRHEEIHGEQQKEMLVVGFYLWYAVEWIVRVLVCLECHMAYRMVSFEQEAYWNEGDERYFEKRRHYAWIRYL